MRKGERVIGWALVIVGAYTYATADPAPPTWVTGLVWVAIGTLALSRT